MNKYKLKQLIKKTGANLGKMEELFNNLFNTVNLAPETVTFTTKLKFDTNKNMIATGSSEAFVFTVDTVGALDSNVVTISIPTGVASTVDFTAGEFEVRRNDFDSAVDCVAYCSYEFGKVAVSILPNVAV